MLCVGLSSYYPSRVPLTCSVQELPVAVLSLHATLDSWEIQSRKWCHARHFGVLETRHKSRLSAEKRLSESQGYWHWIKGRKWKVEERKAKAHFQRIGCQGASIMCIMQHSWRSCYVRNYLTAPLSHTWTSVFTVIHMPSVHLPCCCSSGPLPVVIYSPQQECSDME